MFIGKVVGNVVSTKKTESLTGNRFLIVSLLDTYPIQEGQEKRIVAIDLIGAGQGEYVLVSNGSAARVMLANPNTPVDACIIGIIDTYED